MKRSKMFRGQLHVLAASPFAYLELVSQGENHIPLIMVSIMENWQTSLLYQVFTNCPLCVHMQAVWQDVPTVGLISILLQD